MALLVATEVAGLVIATGGAGAVLQKAVTAMRRFARLLDGFLGDGTAKHPSVPDRLTGLEDRLALVETAVTAAGEKIDSHVDGDAQQWLAEGQEWGHRLDSQVEGLDQRVSVLEGRIQE